MTNRAMRFVFLAGAMVVSSGLRGQAKVELVIRTFPLQHLSNSDAAKLVAPYMLTHVPTAAFATAEVFEAGNAVHAITVRADAEVIARVDSLLTANDRPRATVIFRFQVIAATDSAVRDPAISVLDAELRNLFRFNGYRLLSQNSAWVDDGENFSATMRGADGYTLLVAGQLRSVRRDGAKGNVQMTIGLERTTREMELMGIRQTISAPQSLLSTGLSIPLGQTVVVGSAMTGGNSPALILTVRPELAIRP